MKLDLKKLFSGLGIKSGDTGKVFFGWYTVLTSSLMGVQSSGTWYYGFSAYFKPLAQEFGWSRTVTSSLWSIGRFEGGLEGSFGGKSTDIKYEKTILPKNVT